jgi:hypothetical protein
VVDEGTLSDYIALCEGWCHCFRQPDRYITARFPTELISESDFTDPRAVRRRGEEPKEFDFVYVCLPGAAKEQWKNWELAKRCLHTLCCQMDLTGLLLGRWQILDLPFRRNLTVRGDLSREDLFVHLARSRLLFVPSVLDASPRIIPEALCVDTPVVVNRDILGGWKYVNESTGSFFCDEGDVGRAVETCLNRSLRPRKWFEDHHGPDRASMKLSALLHRLDTEVSPSPSLRLESSAIVPVDVIRRLALSSTADHDVVVMGE